MIFKYSRIYICMPPPPPTHTPHSHPRTSAKRWQAEAHWASVLPPVIVLRSPLGGWARAAGCTHRSQHFIGGYSGAERNYWYKTQFLIRFQSRLWTGCLMEGRNLAILVQILDEMVHGVETAAFVCVYVRMYVWDCSDMKIHGHTETLQTLKKAHVYSQTHTETLVRKKWRHPHWHKNHRNMHKCLHTRTITQTLQTLRQVHVSMVSCHCGCLCVCTYVRVRPQRQRKTWTHGDTPNIDTSTRTFADSH